MFILQVNCRCRFFVGLLLSYCFSHTPFVFDPLKAALVPVVSSCFSVYRNLQFRKRSDGRFSQHMLSKYCIDCLQTFLSTHRAGELSVISVCVRVALCVVLEQISMFVRVLRTSLTLDILLREISSDDTLALIRGVCLPLSLSLSEISSGTTGLFQYLNKIGDLVWTTIDLPLTCLVFFSAPK